MLEVPINWKLPNSVPIDERGHRVINLNTDIGWTVCFCVNEFNFWGVSYITIESIEIHRINVATESSVSGELKFTRAGVQYFETKFSQLFKIGQSFTEISTNKNLLNYSGMWCNGSIKITDISEKVPVSLASDEEHKFKIQHKSLEELSNDLEKLLLPGSTCIPDVTLKCNGVSILAHKTILSARSCVFAAMFAHPMKERLKNEADITDVDESTLKDMLKYMYTGKTPDLTVDSAKNLLFAADKYQLQDLKAVCVYFLKNTVSLQNVWKILVLGDMLSADLKSFAVDYICNKCGKFSAIENAQEWKELRKEKPGLAMDLLESLVKYRDAK